jgi:hypothetical protein
VIRLAILIATALLFSAAPALALPVAAVAAFIGVSATGIVAAAATFVVNTVISMGLSAVVNKLFAPKMPSSAEAAQERQASITQLNVGEVAREFVFGETANAGSLAAAFNYGGKYGTDHVVKIVVVADHRCDGLKGFYVNDTEVGFVADGAVADYGGQLSVYWRDGSEGQQFPADLLAAWKASPLHGHTAPETGAILTGCAYIVFDYICDAPDAENPIWGGNHPQFLPILRGGRFYDPRKDSTVPGGDGPHRWADPSTWAWTRNLAIVRYNWLRGAYYLDRVAEPRHLLVGRGLSALEAPPERVIAAANVCDELVDDGQGGTEPRYLADGVIRSSQPFDQVEAMFEACCGGKIVQPEGGVELEPGQARTPIVQITDDDLVVGREVEFDHFASDASRVNTVIPRYIEPAQRYADHAAPVLRDILDVLAEGPREETLPLSFVTRVSQAMRVGEMRRRQARLERTAKIVLPPWFAEVEEGDWIEWTSRRHTDGEPVVFRVGSYSLSEGWENTLVLAETSFAVYGHGGLPLPSAGGHTPTLPPGALVLDEVTAQAIQIEGDDTLIPAVRFTWATPVDAAIGRIRAEVRKFGQTAAAPTTTDNVNAGELIVTNGVPIQADIEVRLVPLGDADRPIVPSPWIALTTGELRVPGITTIGGLTPEQLVAELKAASAQGAALNKAMMEAFLRLSEERAQLYQETFYNGQRIRSIVLDEIEERGQGDAFILSRVSLMGLEVDGGAAFRLSDTTLKVTDAMTWGQYRDSLQASFGSVNAAITSEATVRAGADEAMASTLSTVSTTVGGHTASISTLASSVGGLQAQYVLSVSAGNRVAGMRLAAGGGVSSIAFSASQIGFTNGVTDKYPFAIVDNEVHATSFRVDRVQANSIVTNSLVGGAVSSMLYSEQSAGGAAIGASDTQIFSMSFTSTGGAHALHLNVQASHSGGGEAGVLVTIRRNGGLIGTRSFWLRQSFSYTGSFSVFDQPGAGTHTYTISVAETAGSDHLGVAQSSNMIITELKR